VRARPSQKQSRGAKFCSESAASS